MPSPEGRLLFSIQLSNPFLRLTGKSSPRSSATCRQCGATRFQPDAAALGLRWGIRLPRTARDLCCSWVSAASYSFAVADRGDGVPDRQILNRYPRPSPRRDSIYNSLPDRSSFLSIVS